MAARNHSRKVQSSQVGIHPRLPGLLDRHRAVSWLQPLHRPTVAAFERLQRCLDGNGGGLILDSGCGTAQSTQVLGERFPESTVIGVDKSLNRLGRAGANVFPHVENNVIRVHAQLESFWRLALAAGWKLEHHYLFYPNPWPKPGHIQRRWHGHPVFPDMLALGGRIEMRTNWATYAEEFAFAANRLAGSDIEPGRVEASGAVSPFERKYRDSGHALWSVVVPAQSSGVK